MLEAIAFYSMGSLALVSALLVVTLRNTVHSALCLGLCLLGVAGVFGALGADFLFASQLLIYVGGIAVLIIFAVMLLGRTSDLHLTQVNQEWLAALPVALITLGGLLRLLQRFRGAAAPGAPAPSAEPLGRLMMGPCAVPFELVSLVLLAALLGAVFFSRTDAAGRREPGGKA